jgi:hypothetical protein
MTRAIPISAFFMVPAGIYDGRPQIIAMTAICFIVMVWIWLAYRRWLKKNGTENTL